MTVLVLALISGALADCAPAQRAAGALDDAIRAADAAIDALDPASLEASARALEQAVACREAAVTVQQAADVHRVLGVLAFVGGDLDASDLWFGASRALNPAAPLGHAIGGPIESAWARALPSSPPDRVALPTPRKGALWIDGQGLGSRPRHLPYVAQLELDGAIALSAVHRAGTVPTYPTRGPDPSAPERGRRRSWTLAAGGSAAISAGLLAGAAVTRARYRDPDLPDDRADALIPLNRALGTGGFAFGAVALGLGGVAVAREW